MGDQSCRTEEAYGSENYSKYFTIFQSQLGEYFVCAVRWGNHCKGNFLPSPDFRFKEKLFQLFIEKQVTLAINGSQFGRFHRDQLNFDPFMSILVQEEST